MIFLISFYYVGLVAIPLGLETEVPLVIIIGVLAGIILLGAFERKRGMDEIVTYSPRRVIFAFFIGAISIIVIILLILAGIHPPGMDPAVPFLFVIPPLAWLFVVAVVVEEAILLLKLDKSTR
nr:MAG: hypothetical protein AM324_15415 [Candidatus Thorarchaeota archaeon SMTZ1-83]